MVQPKVLQHDISFGRGAINSYFFAAMYLLADESGHVIFDAFHPGGKLPIGSGLAQTHLGFLRAHGVQPFRRDPAIRRVTEVSLVSAASPDQDSKASSIDVIELRIGNYEVMPLQQVLERL